MCYFPIRGTLLNLSHASKAMTELVALILRRHSILELFVISAQVGALSSFCTMPDRIENVREVDVFNERHREFSDIEPTPQ